jgi:hypothetical protein
MAKNGLLVNTLSVLIGLLAIKVLKGNRKKRCFAPHGKAMLLYQV